MKTTNTGKVDLYSDFDLQNRQVKEVQKEQKIEKPEKIIEPEKTAWDKKLEKDKEKELDEMLKKLNTSTDILNKGIIFEKNYDYDRIVVKVIDKDTGKVIKQLPPDHVLEFNRLYQEFTGMLFDVTV